MACGRLLPQADGSAHVTGQTPTGPACKLSRRQQHAPCPCKCRALDMLWGVTLWHRTRRLGCARLLWCVQATPPMATLQTA